MQPPAATQDPARRGAAHHLTARLDRIEVWALPYSAIILIGLGLVFTLFATFDINVSFVQTCVQLQPGCTPADAFGHLTVPVVLNLAGYVAGTLILSPLSDRIGRRNTLMITMVVGGLGSLYTAFAPDMANFDAARTLTGVGIGADLAVINAYISEIAPQGRRGRFTAIVLTLASLGALLGIWLGLLLTTEPAAWPAGLPFAQAGGDFTTGWRWMYLFGALLALAALLLWVELPESPRWLISRGRLYEAEIVVRAMERHAERRGPLAEPDLSAPGAANASTAASYREVFRDRRYRDRAALLTFVWVAGFTTVYGLSSDFTAVLTTLGYPAPEAGVIVAVGTVGFNIQGLFAIWLAERLDRRRWLPIGALITLVGVVLVAEAGSRVYLAFAGAVVVFFGFNIWFAPLCALSAESFPTRARTTGFALVDGIGHLGGGIGVLVIARYVTHLGALGALLLIASFQVIAALAVQSGPRTRGLTLDEISP